MNPVRTTPDKSREFAAHFGFLKEPFTKEIAAKALFISAPLQALFTRLKALLSRRGMALITGEVGSGKSTAIRAFAELRLFTNFKIDSHSPMTLILLAQPEFRKLIQLKALEAFNPARRDAARASGRPVARRGQGLCPASPGGGRSSRFAGFTDDVIAGIYQQAKGLPRLINTLCYECLWEIYAQNKNLVDLPTLEKVLCRLDGG